MTGIVWCERGHDVTLAINIYTTRNGKRYCRPCRIENQRAYRIMRNQHNPRQPTRQDQMRRWAERAWSDMTPRDRVLVRHALANMELEQ